MLFEILVLPWKWCRSGMFCVLNTVFRNWCVNTLSIGSMCEMYVAFPQKIQLIFLAYCWCVISPFVSVLIGIIASVSNTPWTFWIPHILVWTVILCFCIWEWLRRHLNAKYSGAKSYRKKEIWGKKERKRLPSCGRFSLYKIDLCDLNWKKRHLCSDIMTLEK